MRILICEDDWSIRRVIELTLQVRGHEVDAAESADEAIATFDRRCDEGIAYGLIILDVMMPVRSGFAVGGHVRGRGYKGRLVFLTAARAEYENMAYLNAEYWHKPDALDRIVERVEGTAWE